jgi:2-polyprenyl-3-methyl-5-hydroxy-6-metoxy-1,4-benzoquinol methylase
MTTQPLPFAEKYASKNPVSRYLIARFIESLSLLVRKAALYKVAPREAAPRTILEIGCGEGFLALALARQGYAVRGIDVREEAIAFASRRAREMGMAERGMLSFETGDIYNLSAEECREDLVVCCEVLEHLDYPEAALDRLAALPAEYAVLSVPREPLWRFLNLCRFKYLGDWGNTPGHVNHWSKNAFLSFLKKRYTVLDVLTPVPWTMALCRRT